MHSFIRVLLNQYPYLIQLKMNKKPYFSIGLPILELPELGAFDGLAFLGFLTSFFPPLSLDIMPP